MPPNLEPIVSIGNFNAHATIVSATKATIAPGNRGANRRAARIIASALAATIADGHETVSK